MRIKSALLATSVALAFSSGAFAADMRAPGPVYKAPPAPMAAPYYNWSGLYIGGHLGYAWQDTDTTAVTGSATFPVGFGFASARSEGGLGGGQVGYNYQFGYFVLGGEAQFSWANLESNTRSNSPTIAGRFTESHGSTDWITTAAARFGVAIQNSLLYGKVGGAWAATDSFSETFTGGNQLIATTTGSAKRHGWVAGAGIEYGFAPGWSAKIEYNYIDLGTDRQERTQVNTAAFGGATSTTLRDVDTQISLVKVGINYRLNFFGSGMGGAY